MLTPESDGVGWKICRGHVSVGRSVPYGLDGGGRSPSRSTRVCGVCDDFGNTLAILQDCFRLRADIIANIVYRVENIPGDVHRFRLLDGDVLLESCIDAVLLGDVRLLASTAESFERRSGLVATDSKTVGIFDCVCAGAWGLGSVDLTKSDRMGEPGCLRALLRDFG